MSPNSWSGVSSKKLDSKKLFSFFTISLTITNLASIQKILHFIIKEKKDLLPHGYIKKASQ